MRWFALLFAASAWAQVPLTVQNAAWPPAGIAPGTLIELFPSPPVANVPACTSCVTVTIQPQQSTQLFTAQLVSASSPGYWAVVPDDVPPGPATVTLTKNSDGTSVSANVTIIPVAPALFSVRQNGIGPALAQNIVTGAAPSLNQLTNPALPGGFVTLWGTGLRFAASGQVTVQVASTMVAASFAGPAPGFPGVDQINFQLPAGSYTGCYVPVKIYAGPASNSVTLAINPTPGACAHPLGLSYSELQTLDQGGRVPVGSIALFSSLPPPFPQPSQTISATASAMFLSQDAQGVFFMAQPQAPPIIGCIAPLPGGFTIAVIGPPGYGAGNQVTLSGPSGNSLEMPGQNGFYSGSTMTPLVAGPWQVSAPGGPDISAFQQAFTLPPIPRLTSVSQLGPLTAGKGDVVVAWDPTGYGVGDIMTVELGNTSLKGAFTPTTACTAYAASGQLLAPAPRPGPVPIPDTVSLSVAPLAVARVQFSAQLTAGGTMPVVINYTLSPAPQPVTLSIMP